MHFRCICFFIKLKTQPSKNRNENRRRPERWRSKSEIAVFRWSVYSHLRGVARGSEPAGVEAFLWQVYRRFFAPSKKWVKY